jgi:hypothetical protein
MGHGAVRLDPDCFEEIGRNSRPGNSLRRQRAICATAELH